MRRATAFRPCVPRETTCADIRQYHRPVYRDDHDAAIARINSLEAELGRVHAEVARLERQQREGCTSGEHARQMRQIEALTREIEQVRSRARGGHALTQHKDLEDRLAALHGELADVDLLVAGDGVMTQQLEACEREIERLEAARNNEAAGQASAKEEVHLTVAAQTYGDVVWVPRRGPIRSAARWVASTGTTGIGLATMVGALGFHSLSGALLGLGVALFGATQVSRRRREDEIEGNQAPVSPKLLGEGDS